MTDKEELFQKFNKLGSAKVRELQIGKIDAANRENILNEPEAREWADVWFEEKKVRRQRWAIALGTIAAIGATIAAAPTLIVWINYWIDAGC